MANGALTISRLTLSDTGMYQCVAGNKHGEVYSNAELRVIGKTHSRPIATFLASDAFTWWLVFETVFKQTHSELFLGSD